MSTETKHDYCRRAAVNTALWLRDRSANLHPLAMNSLDDIVEMLGDRMQAASEFGAVRLKPGVPMEEVYFLLEGFFWGMPCRVRRAYEMP